MIAIFCYVALQIGIGYWVSKKVSNETDYFVAGRSLGYPLVIFSVFATWFGAETCVGAAGEARIGGLNGVITDPFGYGLTIIFFGLFLAVPLWKQKLITLADLYRRRYGGVVEQTAAFLMIPTSLMWAAAQIRAFGMILSSSAPIDLNFAIGLASFVVLIYTVLGGLLADAITDLLQGSILVIGLAILCIVILKQPESGPALAAINQSAFQAGEPLAWYLHLENWAIPILGSLVAQELVARVVAARSPKIAKKGTLFAGGLYLLVGLMPVGLGILSIHLIPDLAYPEQALPELAKMYLPKFLSIIFLGALVSAILSTVDSALLVAGSLFSHNILTRWINNPSESKKLLWARVTVAGFSIICFVLAISADSVYGLVEEASAFGSSGIVVITFVGLYSKWGDVRHALASLGFGLISYVFAAYVFGLATPFLLSLLAASLGFFVGFFLPKGMVKKG